MTTMSLNKFICNRCSIIQNHQSKYLPSIVIWQPARQRSNYGYSTYLYLYLDINLVYFKKLLDDTLLAYLKEYRLTIIYFFERREISVLSLTSLSRLPVPAVNDVAVTQLSMSFMMNVGFRSINLKQKPINIFHNHISLYFISFHVYIWNYLLLGSLIV